MDMTNNTVSTRISLPGYVMRLRFHPDILPPISSEQEAEQMFWAIFGHAAASRDMSMEIARLILSYNGMNNV